MKTSVRVTLEQARDALQLAVLAMILYRRYGSAWWARYAASKNEEAVILIALARAEGKQ